MSSAADKAEKRRKAKQAQQKKLLIMLLPILVALVAWQGPKTLKQLKGAQAPAPAAAAAPQPAADASVGQAAATPAPAAGAPVTASAEAAIAAVSSLPDTDLPPASDEGQLISFSRFEARDPFVALIEDSAADGAPETPDDGVSTVPATTPATPTAIPTGTPPPPTTTVTTGPTTTNPTSVSIQVNGTLEVHVVGDVFPQTDPAFRVISFSSTAVVIGLSDGAFSDGQQYITIRKGESVTLVSQPDGARFTIKLVSVS